MDVVGPDQAQHCLSRRRVAGKREKREEEERLLGSFAFATKLPTIFIHFTEFAYASLWSGCQPVRQLISRMLATLE